MVQGGSNITMGAGLYNTREAWLEPAGRWNTGENILLGDSNVYCQYSMIQGGSHITEGGLV